MYELRDQVAIVTGGANGVGRALCRGLAGAGARVVIADIEDRPAEQLAAELTRQGSQCLPLHVDVAGSDSTVEMAHRTLERFGRIDVLVTCAAIYSNLARKQFLEIELEEWNRVLAVNLTGAQLSARAVVPAMKEQRSGVIVNMGSVNAYLAPEGRAHYSAGKAALENLTKTLARELGPAGIRVNALSPGLVRNDRAIVPQERYRQTAQDRALRKEMVPEDLVGPLLFLCSDDARVVTGHSLVVDGGQIFR